LSIVDPYIAGFFMTMTASTPPTETDLLHLRRCIALASQARDAGQLPFGALVADENGQILMEAQNQARPPDGDPTQHAELLAVSKVAKLIPPELLAKAIDPTLAPEFTEARPADVRRHWADVTRARAALGFTAPVGIEEGLSRYVAWFREAYPDPAACLRDEVVRNW